MLWGKLGKGEAGNKSERQASLVNVGSHCSIKHKKLPIVNGGLCGRGKTAQPQHCIPSGKDYALL